MTAHKNATKGTPDIEPVHSFSGTEVTRAVAKNYTNHRGITDQYKYCRTTLLPSSLGFELRALNTTPL